MLAKLIGRNDERPSRFHTRRGEPAPLSAWRTLPPAVGGRWRGGATDQPWLAPGAVAYLANLLRPSDRMLELGGGASTIWSAERVAEVVTVKAHDAWTRQLADATSDKGVTVVHSSVKKTRWTSTRSARSTWCSSTIPAEGDLDRQDVLRRAAATTRPALVILDDSNREQYQDAQGLLHTSRRFRGFRPSLLQLTETTVWTNRSY